MPYYFFMSRGFVNGLIMTDDTLMSLRSLTALSIFSLSSFASASSAAGIRIEKDKTIMLLLPFYFF
jgi:hypothetical protein